MFCLRFFSKIGKPNNFPVLGKSGRSVCMIRETRLWTGSFGLTQNRREIDCCASAFMAALLSALPSFFGARQNWHNDEGDTGQRDSRNTVFRRRFPCEVRYRLICDVDDKGEQADPYNI